MSSAPVSFRFLQFPQDFGDQRRPGLTRGDAAVLCGVKRLEEVQRRLPLQLPHALHGDIRRPVLLFSTPKRSILGNTGSSATRASDRTSSSVRMTRTKSSL